MSRPMNNRAFIVRAIMLACAASVSAASVPALASNDENLLADDDGEVSCTISSRGLTRISLRDDRFVSISKLATGVDSEDFNAVHEPNRGDIYISVPADYSLQDVSFFGTTQRGFVYKFSCRLGAVGTHQIFVTNRTAVEERPVEVARRADPDVAAAELVRAMYAGNAVDGYEIRQPNRAPQRLGPLTLQFITEYRGIALTGRVVRIENVSREAVPLDDRTIGPESAVAVSVTKSSVGPGEVAMMFVIVPTTSTTGYDAPNTQALQNIPLGLERRLEAASATMAPTAFSEARPSAISPLADSTPSRASDALPIIALSPVVVPTPPAPTVSVAVPLPETAVALPLSASTGGQP